MQVKLLRQVLVGDADVIATPRGTVVDLPDDKAKHFIDNGIGEAAHEAHVKKAPEPLNKMAHAPANKKK